MKYVEIIKGPHILFKGGNGSKTAGITVRSLGSVENVEKLGYSREWSINGYTLARLEKQSPDFTALYLGLSIDEYKKLVAEVLALEV